MEYEPLNTTIISMAHSPSNTVHGLHEICIKYHWKPGGDRPRVSRSSRRESRLQGDVKKTTEFRKIKLSLGRSWMVSKSQFVFFHRYQEIEVFC